ncbi:B3 domain-containing protein [Arabidopsis thaliana]|uniref:B3 domain-containing protein At3g19184 n=3 Tax=Arabidopsis TaxID=3701 RepID=Y3918_ARATH|eukprot:NP_001030726.2 AP2/B3-like transcriptional factor family protein [Arabidopsis thaliana]
MVESELSYEQIRLNRVEENKKRMGELNLNKLAQSLRVSSSSSSSSKPSPAKPRTMRIPVDFSEVRRSSRAKGPPPSYKEFGLEPLERRPRRSSRRRDLLNRVYASDDARMYAFDRAEKLQSSLDSEYASFTKPMLQSHVTGGFWLGLPLPFCKAHMPKRDVIMTLVDEEEEESQAKYLAQKNGLSGGWRGFAIDHQLVDGDAVVFHLIARTTFKVYIIRVNDDANNDSDGNEVNDDDSDGNEEDRDNDNESNEKQKETVSEGRQLRSSGKRKRRGRK